MVQFQQSMLHTATSSGTKVFIPPSSPLTTTSQGATADSCKIIACPISNFCNCCCCLSHYASIRINHVTGSNFSPFPADIDALRGKSGVYCTCNSTWTWSQGTIRKMDNRHSTLVVLQQMLGNIIGGYWKILLGKSLCQFNGSYPKNRCLITLM